MTPAQKADAIGALYGPPMQCLADSIRAFITAAPGKDLIAVDFAAIEARGIQWLSGNDKVLDGFRAGDVDPSKPDAYCIAATETFGEPVTKKDERRKVGKVQVLSLGYQGGVAAMQKMAASNRVDMATAYEPLMAVASTGQVAEAEKACKQKLRQFPKMSREFFIASDIAKQRWRASNAKVVQYWRDLQDAAIDAVLQPGSAHLAGATGREVTFKKSGSFLFCRLPSGRVLTYPYPAIERRPVPWGETRIAVEPDEAAAVEKHGDRLLDWEDGIAKILVPEWRNALTYMCDDRARGGWIKTHTYSGALAENITQAICRDLLTDAMFRVEAAGYPIVSTVYDEIVTEQDEAFGSVEEVERLMCITSPWAAGFPVAAEGWRAKRYRK